MLWVSSMQVLEKKKDGICKAINDITLVILNLKKLAGYK